MSTAPSIAGWQHIESGPVLEGDRFYREGHTFADGLSVLTPEQWSSVEDGWAYLEGYLAKFRIYRRIPVAKQGDNDHEMRMDEAQQVAAIAKENGQAHYTRELVMRSGLPTDAAERKKIPLITGVLFYFPDALCEVAKASLAGQKQHTPGEPLHWDRSKSSDEFDAMGRHLIERGKIDTDGVRHLGKAAWRLLAALQKEIEEARKESP